MAVADQAIELVTQATRPPDTPPRGADRLVWAVYFETLEGVIARLAGEAFRLARLAIHDPGDPELEPDALRTNAHGRSVSAESHVLGPHGRDLESPDAPQEVTP